MKALCMYRQGGPEALTYEDVPQPQLLPGDALVRVCAAAITPTELTWDSTYQAANGHDRLPTIPCHDVSGVVEAVASDGSEVKVGDAVYGLTSFWRNGSAAEFVAARAAELAPKPASIDHTQSAALPLSSLTAWQALVDHARLRAGQRLLVHGGAGGVGTCAVQLGRSLGAHVIATASAHNHDFLRDLGADECVDYTTTRFEDAVDKVDVVLDAIGGETLDRSWAVVRRGGVLVTVAGSTSRAMQAKFGVRGISFIVEPNRSQLITIARLVENGCIHAVIADSFALMHGREAFERGLQGHTRGKLVLKVSKG